MLVGVKGLCMLRTVANILKKPELSCVGGSVLSKTGGAIEGKTPFKYMGRTW